jgi:hypothetical protein
MNIVKLLELIWPLLVVQLGLQIYSIYDLVKHRKTRNLTPLIWGVIIVLGEIIGAAAYFLLGRSEE